MGLYQSSSTPSALCTLPDRALLLYCSAVYRPCNACFIRTRCRQSAPTSPAPQTNRHKWSVIRGSTCTFTLLSQKDQSVAYCCRRRQGWMYWLRLLSDMRVT